MYHLFTAVLHLLSFTYQHMKYGIQVEPFFRRPWSLQATALMFCSIQEFKLFQLLCVNHKIGLPSPAGCDILMQASV